MSDEGFSGRLGDAADRLESSDPDTAKLLRDAARRVYSLMALTQAYDTRHKELQAQMAGVVREKDAALRRAEKAQRRAAPVQVAKRKVTRAAPVAPPPVAPAAVAPALPQHPLAGRYCHKTSDDPEHTKWGWNWQYQCRVEDVVGDRAMLLYFDLMGSPGNIKPTPVADLLDGSWIFYRSHADWLAAAEEASTRHWGRFHAELDAKYGKRRPVLAVQP
jgi:hypothetical protein